MFAKINSIAKKTSGLLLVGFIIVLFFVNAYNKTYKYRPITIHQWRQTDCLSITKNYFEEGMHFFKPKIHWQGAIDGKAVSECPILNYTVAFLWKIFGEHEYIYRFLEYFIFIISMLVLFRTLVYFFNSGLTAFFITSLFLTSPLLVYYSFNFIADVPALSFCILTYCYFFWFYKTKKIKFFYLSLLLGTIAVLIKASALVGLGTIVFFSMADILGFSAFLRTEKLFKLRLVPMLLIFASVAIVVAWYQYAIAYNKFNNGVFLLTVLPIWEMNEDALVKTVRILLNELFPVFFNRAVFFIFLLALIYVISNFKRLDYFFRYTFVFSFIFFIGYLLFFFQVFTVHDYYLNNLMIFPVITFFCVSNILSQTNILSNHKIFLRSVAAIIIFFNVFYSAAYYRSRMIQDDSLCDWYPFMSVEEKKYSDWLLWNRTATTAPLETITPDLRKAGVKREDLVLSIPDNSFNISLYLMDQKGETVASFDYNDTTRIPALMEKRKYAYLVLIDPAIKQQKAFTSISHRLEPLLSKQHVEVFKVKD